MRRSRFLQLLLGVSVLIFSSAAWSQSSYSSIQWSHESLEDFEAGWNDGNLVLEDSDAGVLLAPAGWRLPMQSEQPERNLKSELSKYRILRNVSLESVGRQSQFLAVKSIWKVFQREHSPSRSAFFRMALPVRPEQVGWTWAGQTPVGEGLASTFHEGDLHVLMRSPTSDGLVLWSSTPGNAALLFWEKVQEIPAADSVEAAALLAYRGSLYLLGQYEARWRMAQLGNASSGRLHWSPIPIPSSQHELMSVGVLRDMIFLGSRGKDGSVQLLAGEQIESQIHWTLLERLPPQLAPRQILSTDRYLYLLHQERHYVERKLSGSLKQEAVPEGTFIHRFELPQETRIQTIHWLTEPLDSAGWTLAWRVQPRYPERGVQPWTIAGGDRMQPVEAISNLLEYRLQWRGEGLPPDMHRVRRVWIETRPVEQRPRLAQAKLEQEKEQRKGAELLPPSKEHSPDESPKEPDDSDATPFSDSPSNHQAPQESLPGNHWQEPEQPDEFQPMPADKSAQEKAQEQPRMADGEDAYSEASQQHQSENNSPDDLSPAQNPQPSSKPDDDNRMNEQNGNRERIPLSQPSYHKPEPEMSGEAAKQQSDFVPAVGSRQNASENHPPANSNGQKQKESEPPSPASERAQAIQRPIPSESSPVNQDEEKQKSFSAPESTAGSIKSSLTPDPALEASRLAGEETSASSSPVHRENDREGVTDGLQRHGANSESPVMPVQSNPTSLPLALFAPGKNRDDMDSKPFSNSEQGKRSNGDGSFSGRDKLVPDKPGLSATINPSAWDTVPASVVTANQIIPRLATPSQKKSLHPRDNHSSSRSGDHPGMESVAGRTIIIASGLPVPDMKTGSRRNPSQSPSLFARFRPYIFWGGKHPGDRLPNSMGLWFPMLLLLFALYQHLRRRSRRRFKDILQDMEQKERRSSAQRTVRAINREAAENARPFRTTWASHVVDQTALIDVLIGEEEAEASSRSVSVINPEAVTDIPCRSLAVLPQISPEQRLVVAGERLYLFSRGQAVFSSRLDKNGGWRGWSAPLGVLPQTSPGFSVCSFMRWLYFVPGAKNRSTTPVYACERYLDGALSTWRVVGEIPEGISHHGLAGGQTALFLVGGRTSKGESNRVYQMTPDADGMLRQLVRAPALPSSLAPVGCRVQKRRLFAWYRGEASPLRSLESLWCMALGDQDTPTCWRRWSHLPEAGGAEEVVVSGCHLVVTQRNGLHRTLWHSGGIAADWEKVPGRLARHQALIWTPHRLLMTGSSTVNSPFIKPDHVLLSQDIPFEAFT